MAGRQWATIRSNSPRLARVQGQWGWANSTSVSPTALRSIALPPGHSAKNCWGVAGELSYQASAANPTPMAPNHTRTVAMHSSRRRANADSSRSVMGITRRARIGAGKPLISAVKRVTRRKSLSTRDDRPRNGPATTSRVDRLPRRTHATPGVSGCRARRRPGFRPPPFPPS